MFEYKTEKYEKTILAEDYIRDCVNVEYFENLCKSCPNYGRLWSCPGYDFDVLQYWKKYRYLKIFGTKIIIPEEWQNKSLTPEEVHKIWKETLWKAKNEMMREGLEMEKQIPGSVHLSAGACLLCSEGTCTRLTGQPCRHPDQMRYSIESLGGDVSKAAAMLGQTLEWAPPDRLPSHYLLIGGLLY